MRAVLLSVVLVAGAVGCGKIPKPQSATKPEATIYLRKDFDALIKGKTQNEVLTLAGTPDSTSKTGSGECWYYRRRTKDEITGKLDGSAQVVWRNGVVDQINY